MADHLFNTKQYLGPWDFTAIIIISLIYTAALITHIINSAFLCDQEGDKLIANKIIFGLSTSGLVLFTVYTLLVITKKVGGYDSSTGYKPFVLAMTLAIFVLIVANFIVTMLSTPEIVKLSESTTEKEVCLYKMVGMILTIFIVWFLNYYGGFGVRTRKAVGAFVSSS